ncbi:helix-loop-helix DNA-binding domain-containing protein [Aspergillus cavernicola]|uniref:Helix-loop-helix DNA-binding domain-containing protein n=1 Tax=Aspergillus cavernicola TaxID=176166 RepID=A0ABR4HP28_9EURO
MEQDPSLSWSDMPPPAEDEFSNFLEFGMQFADLEGQHGPTDHLPSRSVAHQVAMSTSTAPSQQQQMACMDPDGVTAQSQSYTRMMSDFPLELPGHGQQGIPHSSSYSNSPITPAFYAQKPQMFHPSQQQQPPQHTSQPYIPQGQMMIPPTPNSMELHGNAATYPQRVSDNPEMYDRYTRMLEEQALYTPLVSPAMTPLESQFRQPEYTIPGEYFSPLTSPAIEAQNANSNGYPIHSGPMTDVNFLHSPVDHGFPASSAPSSPGLARKQRRRQSIASKSFQSRAKKQQSPSVRPLTRTRSRLTDGVMTAVAEGQMNPTVQPQNGSGLVYGSAESSGQDSVSPEPLSEPLMPPPALPSARKSPAIPPQTRQSNTSEPATPAMLMRIQRSPHTRSTSDNSMTPTQLAVAEPHDDIMEDVVLPEVATPSTQLFRAQVTRIDTAVATNTSSPSMSANGTPHLEPNSAALSERNPGSIAPSPHSGPMASPSGPVPRKSETPKLGPVSRKRQSLSSSHPSPSLRPKISPSIQPLVRGDGLSNDASAMYLATKSNYQHILDGTLLPGVSYPETLAENLSSKRTNHKLAEQGRRNRINNALKEIETLIPPAYVQMKNKDSPTCNGKGAIEKEKDKAGNQQISKASTVEMAIDYIKSLQAELEATQTRLAAAEAKLSTGEASQVNGERKGLENEETVPNKLKAANHVSENNNLHASTEASS